MKARDIKKIQFGVKVILFENERVLVAIDEPQPLHFENF